MAWRTVVISNPARLRIRNSQLVVIQAEEVPLPIEDIAVLMIESAEVLLSASVLSRLAEAGATVLVCDDRHLPCAACLPFAGHSRLTASHRLQLSMSEPFRKRCWQIVVRRKVANQAACLDLAGRAGGAGIRSLLPRIASGDSTNIEAGAARRYFPALFGDDFLRGADDAANHALDYGYAVMRAMVARALATYGFLLTQGVHHRSELNAFNLADDFLEPFRPVVDLAVALVPPDSVDSLTQEYRRDLAALLSAEVLSDGKRHGATRAGDILASSLVSACREKDPRLLKLPDLLPLRVHSYE